MAYDQELLTRRLAEWRRETDAFRLPMWKDLPPLELYMDQVILLLKRYLEPLLREQGDKAVTASIINNYVRLKVMPPPVKKKYARIHLAYLIIICVLKQSLSIASIQALLPEEPEEKAVQQLYDGFASQFQTVSNTMAQLVRDPADLPLSGSGHPAAVAAIAATLTKSLTEHLLRPVEQEPES